VTPASVEPVIRDRVGTSVGIGGPHGSDLASIQPGNDGLKRGVLTVCPKGLLQRALLEDGDPPTRDALG
jgi:hypothetical protein